MKLSVIIPFFNPHPAHFSAMLAGLREANWTGFTLIEIILINDGGATIVHDDITHWAANCPQFSVQLIKQPENRGVSCARNAGLAAATGDWIAFHDADDISLPQRFVQSVEFLQAHPQVIAVSGDMHVFDEQNPLTSVRLFPLSHAEICVDNVFYCAMAQPALMLNRQLWQASGIQFTPQMDMAQDWDFLVRLSQYGQLANLGVPLVRYRQHQQQRSSGIQREQANPHVQKIWRDQLQRLGLNDNPAISRTHALLSPYWLWLQSEVSGALDLSADAVIAWGDALSQANASSQYVDAALLQQRISRLQRHWHAGQASAKLGIITQQLF